MKLARLGMGIAAGLFFAANLPATIFNPAVATKVVDAQDKRWGELRAFVDRIYDRYLVEGTHGHFLGEGYAECRKLALTTRLKFGSFDCVQINALLADKFYRSSVARLSKIPVPGLQALLRMARAEQPFPKFGIWLLPFKAGFHRGTGYIAMNLEKIDPAEFLFLFVHELSHAANPDYQALIERYRKLKQKLDNTSFFSAPDLKNGLARPLRISAPENREMLREFLYHGLERGLIEEYRAWTVSLYLYEAVLAWSADQPKPWLWERIPWVESVLAERREDERYDLEGLKRFVFRYLDPRFEDPTGSDLFSRPLVQLELKEIRRQLRSGERQIDMGSFDPILNPK